MLGNVGIERAIISSLCQYGKDAMVEIEDIGVTANSFTIVTNQALFTSIKHLLDNKDHIDQAMLLLTIKDLGYSSLFDNKKDIEFIASLFNFPIKRENIRGFAIRLEKLALGRLAIQKHEEAIESLNNITGVETIDQIVGLSENPIFDLVLDVSKSKDNGPQLLFENVDEVVEELASNPCDTIGIPTPWSCYNAGIGHGLRRGGVNLIGARPKIGKTTFAKELLLHITDTLNIPALMLDTEMSGRDQMIRSLASCSEVPINEIETGRFAKNYLYKQYMDQAVEKLKNNENFWYASVAGKPFEEILATIRRWIVKIVGYNDSTTNDCVIIYDYFKLMDASHLQSLKEYEAIGYQLSRLTDFAKEFDFACLAFVQLNRQMDISQSDRLRWFCHSYTTFEAKSPQEKVDDGPENGNRKLTIKDVRFGTGLDDDDYINLNFQRDINKLTEVGLRSIIGKVKTSDSFDLQPPQNKTEPSTRIELNNGTNHNQEEDVPWEDD